MQRSTNNRHIEMGSEEWKADESRLLLPLPSHSHVNMKHNYTLLGRSTFSISDANFVVLRNDSGMTSNFKLFDDSEYWVTSMS